MGLSIADRGYLEKILDITVKNATEITRMWRENTMMKDIGITSEIEFLTGFLLGDIMKEYFAKFYQGNGRHQNDEEQKEFWELIKSRMPQIKGAIHEAG
jgi:hypothetical protein